MLFTANAIVMIEQDVQDIDMMLEMFKEELISEFLDGEKWEEFSSPIEYGIDLLNTLMDNKSQTKRKRNPKNFTLGKVESVYESAYESTEQYYLDLSYYELQELLLQYSKKELVNYADINDIAIPTNYKETVVGIISYILTMYKWKKGID